jgi:nitrate reductase NapE component
MMFDLLMLALLAVAFVGAVGYIRACERLTVRPDHPDDSSR